MRAIEIIVKYYLGQDTRTSVWFREMTGWPGRGDNVSRSAPGFPQAWFERERDVVGRFRLFLRPLPKAAET